MPKLSIDGDNFRNTNGELIVVMWDDPQHFKSQEPHHTYQVVHAEVDSRRPTIVVDDVPAGTYALVVIHDETHNHRIERDRGGWRRGGPPTAGSSGRGSRPAPRRS